jgi:hypothetical protein
MKRIFLIFTGLGLAAVGSLGACGDGGTGGSGGGAGGGATTSSTSSSTSSSSGTIVCGGKTGSPCPSGTYCSWSDNSCGLADQQGTCLQVPTACAFEAVPWQVCGCDGTTYGDACSAAMNGVDVGAASHCTLAPGQFGCGAYICDTANQYCQVTKSDVGSEPDSYQCVFLPTACTASVPPGGPECTCLEAEPCGMACTKEADGHFVVNCPGG